MKCSEAYNFHFLYYFNTFSLDICFVFLTVVGMLCYALLLQFSRVGDRSELRGLNSFLFFCFVFPVYYYIFLFLYFFYYFWGNFSGYFWYNLWFDLTFFCEFCRNQIYQCSIPMVFLVLLMSLLLFLFFFYSPPPCFLI